MKRTSLFITAIAAITTIGGSFQGHGQTHRVPGTNAEFRGQVSRIRTPRSVIVHDKPAFDALWREANGDSRMPAIDFRSSDVAAVFAGERRTGGYSVRFDRVRRAGRHMVAIFAIDSPSPNMMVTQMLTQPWAMRVFPKSPVVRRIEVREVARPRR